MRRARARGPARLALAALLIALGSEPGAAPVLAHPVKGEARLSRIGPAPEFSLPASDGTRLALADLRGKVVAVTFIFASCADTCPLLTAKLVEVQKHLRPPDASGARFI